MERIGRLWEANAITVADEHLATAISQSVLVKLFDRLTVARPRSRERVLLAAVEGQHHVLGLRMIADVMEGAGFDVLYLGADVPVDALRRFAGEHRPSITGLGLRHQRRRGRARRVHPCGARGLPGHADHARRARGPGGPGRSRIHAGGQQHGGAVRRRAPAAPGARASRPRAPAALRPARREPRGVREFAHESDAVAERMAEVTEGATAMAREYVRLAGRFKDLAFRDPVTDLGNRRAFDDRMHARRGGRGSGALLMIDVDEFKAVNDTHGHAAGDVLLRRIGA